MMLKNDGFKGKIIKNLYHAENLMVMSMVSIVMGMMIKKMIIPRK
jgi:hypothetical protein